MTQDAPNSPNLPQPPQKNPMVARLRNFLIALVAIALTTGLLLGIKTPSATASLTSLAETAVPFELATTNQKPSLVEFYANWCTSCQTMAGDMVQLRDEYGDRVNFVMLNVDNSKWLPEVLRYRVDGIPHFLYMDASGTAIASAIGEQPRSVIAENLAALVAEQPLPYLQSRGRISDVEVPLNPQAQPQGQDDPRSHGAQVKT